MPPAIALAVLTAALRRRGFVHPDVAIQHHAVSMLLSRRWLETYLVVPEAQMGPLAMSLITLPHSVYIVLTSLLVLPFLWLAAMPTGPAAPRILWSLASTGLVVPWSQFAWKGHIDDALVLCCAAAGVWFCERSRPWCAASACIVGMAAKPTAVLLAPVLPVEGLVVAAVATALLWAPFAWSDPAQFLRAGRGIMHVAPQSLWGRVGVAGGAPPGWLRPSQLAVGLGAALWTRARAGVSVAILAAFTVRSLMEMTPAPAYAASLVALALVADARETRAVPVFTALGLAAFWTSQPALDGASGWPRIVAHVALLVVATTTVLRPRGTIGEHPPAASLCSCP